ncbi:DUF4955 domain-containing protein [Psychromonas ossibalaenae]|uniref:DUF4955 domain-containing protein n=1 Tax=Psychromonas ossibalaenae TaxID=444922 RepID=UPI000370CD70|nr:DUF4955 domain-containing protein [Psychromonas ossibalaenae]
MKKYINPLCTAFCIFGAVSSYADIPDVSVKSQADTSIYWTNYVNTRDSNGLYNGDQSIDPSLVMADFSYAGYKNGEQHYQDIDRSDYTEYNVNDYGITAGSTVSSKDKLKKLIHFIEERKALDPDHKAILYFPSGRYIINDAHDIAKIDPEDREDILQVQPIIIRISDFIMKGDGPGKTILYSDVHLLPEDPEKKWTTPYLIRIGAETKDKTPEVSSAITSSHLRGSTFTITVADSSGFKVGDSVELTGVTDSISAVNTLISPYLLEHQPHEPGNYIWTNLTENTLQIEKHIIESIDADRITFTAPLNHEISEEYSWTASVINSVTNIGIEDLTLQGNWQDEFIHHEDAVHDSGYSMLELSNVNNSWINNIEVKDFSQAVNLKNTFNVTAENIQLNGNPGHSALGMMYSNNDLAVNVDDTAATWHAPGVSKYSIGNVYLNLQFDETSGNDLHGEQSMYNLFDNMSGGFVYGRWGASLANQPNHLQGLVYWNPENLSSSNNNGFEFMRINNEYGRIIMPYIIGMTGNTMTYATQKAYAENMHELGKAQYVDMLPETDQAFVESMGESVLPLSLYQAQFEYRNSLEP